MRCFCVHTWTGRGTKVSTGVGSICKLFPELQRCADVLLELSVFFDLLCLIFFCLLFSDHTTPFQKGSRFKFRFVTFFHLSLLHVRLWHSVQIFQRVTHNRNVSQCEKQLKKSKTHFHGAKQGTTERGAARLQPPPQNPQDQNLQNTYFVDVMISKVWGFFPFSRNEPLNLADD
jgi:hypothetical protein